MELSDIMQGGGLVLSGAAVKWIADAAISAWRSRNQRTEARIEPTPLPVDRQDKYVTRGEFNRHVEDNVRDHENLFARLNRNDRETGEIKGMLSSIMDDLRTIKGFMLGGRK